MTPGSRFGPYEILGALGAGGMGVVYRARDTRLRREVALKLLKDEKGGADPSRLLREARLAATLNHPHICTIHEVGEADGTPFMAMELVDGETLQIICRRGLLDTDRLRRIAIQLADAIEHAHAAGIVHGDLKSSNVMITADGRAKILDFGIAHHLTSPNAATRTATSAHPARAGTLSYMSPELLGGEPASRASDIWALGVVLYEMAGGHPPFTGETEAAVSAAILRDDPPSLPASTSPGIVHLIERCLRKGAGERPLRAGEVAMGLRVMESMPAGPVSTGRRSVIALTIAALLIAAIAGSWAWRSRSAAVGAGMPAVKTLAVLPFENLSGATGQEYFSDGMTDLLITELSKVGALSVISRGSVMQYRSRSQPVAEIARDLKADALVQGSVLRDGDHVRVTVALVNPGDGRLLWSDRYDRELKDVLGLQSDIAGQVVRQVRASIAPDEALRLRAPSSRDPRAQDAYLVGRYHVPKKTPADLKKAIGSFQEAIRIDPSYAAAYAGLASAYHESEVWGGAGVGAFAKEIRDAAEHALALDDSLPEAHLVMAGVFEREWKWDSAAAAYRRTLELNPSMASAYQEYSFYLQTVKQEDAAVAAAHRASLLDPFSADILSNEGRVLYRARRYEDSIAAFQRALEIDPAFAPAASRLFEDYLALGQFDKAERQLEKIKVTNGAFATRGAAQLYGRQGRFADARALLKQAEAESVSGVDMAYVFMAIGDHDGALDRLERAVKARNLLAFALRDPRFDPIAATPRFAAVLRSVNLEP